MTDKQLQGPNKSQYLLRDTGTGHSMIFSQQEYSQRTHGPSSGQKKSGSKRRYITPTFLQMECPLSLSNMEKKIAFNINGDSCFLFTSKRQCLEKITEKNITALHVHLDTELENFEQHLHSWIEKWGSLRELYVMTNRTSLSPRVANSEEDPPLTSGSLILVHLGRCDKAALYYTGRCGPRIKEVRANLEQDTINFGGFMSSYPNVERFHVQAASSRITLEPKELYYLKEAVIKSGMSREVLAQLLPHLLRYSVDVSTIDISIPNDDPFSRFPGAPPRRGPNYTSTEQWPRILNICTLLPFMHDNLVRLSVYGGELFVKDSRNYISVDSAYRRYISYRFGPPHPKMTKIKFSKVSDFSCDMLKAHGYSVDDLIFSEHESHINHRTNTKAESSAKIEQFSATW